MQTFPLRITIFFYFNTGTVTVLHGPVRYNHTWYADEGPSVMDPDPYPYWICIQQT